MRSTLVLIVLATACTSAGQSDLDSARDRWDARPHSYTFTSQKSCFCDEDTVRPIRITASSADPDAIASAVFADDLGPVPADVRAFLLTIDGVFDAIQTAIDNDAHRVEATYDPTLGFPVTVHIDQSGIPDTGFTLALSDFSEP